MASLTQDQLSYFEEFGFLPVENVFNPEEVTDPVIEEYHTVLDSLAEELFKEGKISSKFQELPFGKRLTRIMQETEDTNAQYFDFSLPFAGVTKDTPCWFGPAVFKALVNEQILDVVESVIGPEIYSNPVQHVRIKPPEREIPKNKNGQPIIGATIWHQDHGVVTENADETNMLTVWFPLLDAPVEAGPLKVAPGSHKGELLTHCNDYKIPGVREIPEHLFDADGAVPVPMERGGVVILHKRTVHGSLSNVSENIRWSFDLRYNPTGQPTGREIFPGFIARSKKDPDKEFRNAEKWKETWLKTKEIMTTLNQEGDSDVSFGRWDGEFPECA
ncbi:MAG: phytanoyl-CoA dioxygenase [Dehalococcoidia bacterium]|nr:phytanoyl-CoA dioxygenase [Dehalococcoidia bacterium]